MFMNQFTISNDWNKYNYGDNLSEEDAIIGKNVNICSKSPFYSQKSSLTLANLLNTYEIDYAACSGQLSKARSKWNPSEKLL